MSHNFKVLSSRIIENSQSDFWGTARLEWEFYDCYQLYKDEEPMTCTCTHNPIMEICVIKNALNGNIMDVGNVCIKRFLGIDIHLIFAGLKRIKRDIDKPMNLELFKYVTETKHFLTNWEKQFYIDTLKKRKMTQKQKDKRKDINLRVLSYMQKNKKSLLNTQRLTNQL